MEEIGMYTRLQSESINRRNLLKELGIDGRIILAWISDKRGVD
jgi:hypothetical protein